MSEQLQTRYPGLASFTTAQKDIFFGRKQETRDLTNLIAVERSIVLFSKSGYGKTSLLQAGVIPQLYGQQIVPVPIRFGFADLKPEQHFKILFQKAYLQFLDEENDAKILTDNETIWEQIARCPFGQQPAQFTPLLIFDQFEELFTLYPEPKQRRRFVSELANLIHERPPDALRERLRTDLESGRISAAEATSLETAPPMKFVFSIRSDMLHFMDELSEQIPYILRSRYQLFGLKEAQATEAIVAPATLPGAFASQPFAYEPNGLRVLLDVLSKNHEVESFQLQAVCQAIEEKIIRIQRLKTDPVGLRHHETGVPMINSDFYGGRAGIDDILNESYNRRLNSLADLNPEWPDTARRLLEDSLVNRNENRQSVDVVELLSQSGVSGALLNELERQRLVRKEPRLESFYYEISHDTWLNPILKNRNVRLTLNSIALKQKKEDRSVNARGLGCMMSGVVFVVLMILGRFTVLPYVFLFFLVLFLIFFSSFKYLQVKELKNELENWKAQK